MVITFNSILSDIFHGVGYSYKQVKGYGNSEYLYIHVTLMDIRAGTLLNFPRYSMHNEEPLARVKGILVEL